MGNKLIETEATGMLSRILVENGISGEYVLLISKDGLGVLLRAADFKEIVIHKKNNWYTTSKILPPTANIKNLSKICIFSKNDIQAYNQGKKYLLSAFQIYLQNMEFQGESARESHFIKKYKLVEKDDFLEADSIFYQNKKIKMEYLKNKIGWER